MGPLVSLVSLNPSPLHRVIPPPTHTQARRFQQLAMLRVVLLGPGDTTDDASDGSDGDGDGPSFTRAIDGVVYTRVARGIWLHRARARWRRRQAARRRAREAGIEAYGLGRRRRLLVQGLEAFRAANRGAARRAERARLGRAVAFSVFRRARRALLLLRLNVRGRLA